MVHPIHKTWLDLQRLVCYIQNLMLLPCSKVIKLLLLLFLMGSWCRPMWRNVTTFWKPHITSNSTSTATRSSEGRSQLSPLMSPHKHTMKGGRWSTTNSPQHTFCICHGCIINHMGTHLGQGFPSRRCLPSHECYPWHGQNGRHHHWIYPPCPKPCLMICSEMCQHMLRTRQCLNISPGSFGGSVIQFFVFGSSILLIRNLK